MSFHSKLNEKIVSREQAAKVVAQQRVTGRKIVFTNGVFDLLHPGHVDYLAKARDLADFLVLGLNTDESVKRLNKAPNRPVNNLETRAKLLAALSTVDLVVPFNEDTPLELIVLLRPDVLVKGNDYKPEQIAGHDVVTSYGGQVITVELLPGFSSTALINKIKG